MKRNVRLPNFFILGAPKCGTTSLARWLGDHPAVFMCAPKEPYFFGRDIDAYRAVETWNEYVELFSSVCPVHLAVGEASTTYLRSQVAVPTILDRLPDSRFVVCLRNPVEMAASVHAQLVRGSREDVMDLSEAWALQDARRAGQSLPWLTKEPKDLLYADVCALGTQISRLLNHVDRSRVFFVFLDDLRSDPAGVWESLQTFLAIPSDGRVTFGKENTRRVPRSLAISGGVRFAYDLKYSLFPRLSLGIGSWLAELVVRSPSQAEIAMPKRFRQELTRAFSEEVAMIESLTGRDLSAWKEPAI